MLAETLLSQHCDSLSCSLCNQPLYSNYSSIGSSNDCSEDGEYYHDTEFVDEFSYTTISLPSSPGRSPIPTMSNYRWACTTCNSVFHTECIDQWKAETNTPCPLCHPRSTIIIAPRATKLYSRLILLRNCLFATAVTLVYVAFAVYVGYLLWYKGAGRRHHS